MIDSYLNMRHDEVDKRYSNFNQQKLCEPVRSGLTLLGPAMDISINVQHTT